jgi:hypothetical protein
MFNALSVIAEIGKRLTNILLIFAVMKKKVT